MYDIIIIGSGVIGASVARFLSRYNARIVVLEKDEDVSCGTSKANSGISHAGFDAEVGSLKAKFNVLGNKMMKALSEELEFPYKQNGALVLAFDEESKKKLEDLYDRGIKNGVEGLSIITGDEARKIEPLISNEVVWALHAATSGIVSPYEMNIALCENASANGVEFRLNSEVTNICKTQNGLTVTINNGEEIEGKVVINCAGVYADTINNMVSQKHLDIISRKGEYMLLDKAYNYYTKTTLFQTPTKMGKGILVAPTTHGNIIVGPTAVDIESKSDVSTTISGLNEAWKKALLSIPTLNKRGIITQFSGLRAHPIYDDFIIGFSDVEGLYNVAGIESPGLTSAPAIGEYVSDEVAKFLGLELKDNFISHREAIPHFSNLSDLEQEKLIQKNPLYGHVVCRCECVTEGEIVDSINRPVGATTLDGVKRRTRAGMGRCQMGFCTPKIMEIIARELHMELEDVTKKGPGSNIVVGKVK